MAENTVPSSDYREAIVPSLLRFSATERLAAAAVAIALLWAAVVWAMA